MKKKYISPTINVVTIEGLGGFMQTGGSSPNENWDINNGDYEPQDDGYDMENQRQLGKGRFYEDW